MVAFSIPYLINEKPNEKFQVKDIPQAPDIKGQGLHGGPGAIIFPDNL